MRINEEEFIERVQTQGPLPDRESARRTIVATLEVLGERLFPQEAQFVGEELPPTAARALRANPAGSSFDRDEFFRRVAEHEGAPLGFSVEHAEVVCTTLADALTSATLERLHKEIPDFRPLLQPPEPVDSPEPLPHLHRMGHTLADGRPGSTRPLSEAGKG